MTNDQIIELAKQAGDDWEHTLQSDKEFLQRFAELVRNEVLEESAKDTARFMWAMRNMANPFGRHEFGLAQHIIDRGGDGDVDDFRSYVDEMMEYDK